MLEVTDTNDSTWNIVRSDQKEEARLNCTSHILQQIPYEQTSRSSIVLPERNEEDAYDDIASMVDRRYLPDQY